ncbi:molybdopterin-dependent oxidoreductase [uncultured Mameliella sp.]|uniref:molybdopterin-dependent oxidoreductase n=1 Tax=uncultured Mameliella sp. TaxID=1447087 RepID=UPI00345BAC25
MMTFPNVQSASAALFLTFALAGAAPAEHLPEPHGPVILTVEGTIARTNGEGRARLDLQMLRDIGETTITTDTIWTAGTSEFTGVALDDLLDYLGAEGQEIDARAINDYAVTVPIADAVEGGPILAYAMDGKTMSRRDKGPLWLIYPYASSSTYRTEVIYARSIWQLDRMTVLD